MREILAASISNRTNVQSLKLEVHTTQLLERVLIRKNQLESILKEELDLSTRLTQLEEGQMHQAGSLGLETTLLQRLSDLERQKRDVDQQCWRDVNMVIPQLLSAIEGLTASQVRDDILHTPKSSQVATAKVLPAHYVQHYRGKPIA